jgi:quinoprotein glucose dehydrogenase
MRRVVCASLVLAVIGSGAAHQEQTRTVWDGVYTEAQAERGRSAYTQACASCHADDLRGKGTAPSLVDESFTFLWADMSVGDLFERTRLLMPSDRPGSLPSAVYADIIAFIVSKNGFPAGGAELGSDVSGLRQISITNARPPTR